MQRKLNITKKCAPLKKYNVALSFWTASFQYLRLVENVAGETVIQGNVWVMIKDFEEDYEKDTRWSDHTIIIPLIFNLLHGIELLIKGFLLTSPDQNVGKNHNIPDLSRKFLRRFPEEELLNTFFHKYTCEHAMPDILKRFLKDKVKRGRK